MRNPEGESDRSPLRPCFDRRSTQPIPRLEVPIMGASDLLYADHGLEACPSSSDAVLV